MTLHPISEALAQVPLLADLPPADMELIAGCGRNVHLHAGARVFSEGEAADTFYLIRHGRIRLSVHGPDRGGITVATMGDGDLVGWSWLFPPFRWELDATCAADTSAVVLDGACLREKCEQDNALGYRLMQRFAQLVHQRLQQTRLQLLDVYGHRGPGGSGG